MQEIIIRNRRNKGWFYLDNEYLNGYAGLMKPLTSLVYVALCRHADNESQQCFPSMELLAEECNISKPTVIRCIQELEDWNIINVERGQRKNDRQAPNIYTLLDKDVWVKKPEKEQSKIQIPSLPELKSSEEQSKNDSNSRVSDVYCKDTHINYTQEKETIADKSASLISQVIKEMESIDPKNKNYYGNKTQRAACQFLIDNYSYEKVIEMIQIIPSLKTSVPYFPSITTPCELRDKWQKVVDSVNRIKLNRSSKVAENLANVIW